MNAAEIVQTMMDKDYFSQWLGIRVHRVETGSCLLSMVITRDMLNGFGIAHGGITYSLADSALAFASNSNGIKSVSIETSVSHLVSLKESDEIYAEATLEVETPKLGHYKVRVYAPNAPQNTVALFKGIVYKTTQNW